MNRYTCTILTFCLLLLGCSAETVTGKTGIISLHPAVTETIFSLNGEDVLVGRSQYCTTPPRAQQLPAFGTALTPNIEALARRSPDLVIVDTSDHTQSKRIGEVAPILALPWLTTREIISSTRSLGQHIDREVAANALADQYQNILSQTPPETAPSAVMLLGNGELTHKSLWYIKPESIHGAALTAAGFNNAISPGKSGAPSMSLETLITLNPDTIIVLSTEDNTDSILGSLQPIKPLRAVQNNQLFVVSGSRVMSSGPGILELVSQLKALPIHQK